MGLVWFQSFGNDDDETNASVVFWHWIAFVLTLGWAGLCMGAVGVGGVFIVPSMIAILNVPAPIAVASVAPAYLASSTSGMWAYRGTLQQHGHVCMTLMMGALLGGFLASFVVEWLPTSLLTTLLAFFCIMFGLYKLATTVACSTLPLGWREGSPARHSNDDDDDDSNNFGANGHRNTHTTEVGNMTVKNKGNHDDDETDESSSHTPASQTGPTLAHKTPRHRITYQKHFAVYEPQDHNDDNDHGVPSRVENFALGTAVGLGSALSGTSGPLLFIPSFLLCHPHQSAAWAVALSQAIGAPMALAMMFGTLFLQKVSNSSDSNTTVDIDAGLSVIVGTVTSLCVPWGKTGMRLLCQVLGEKEGNRAIMACVALLILGSGCYMVFAES